jgi:hypothetical protein
MTFSPSKHWLPISSAAQLLGTTPNALRKVIERTPRQRDGTHAFDGILARKLGGRWRVLLGAEWRQPL